MDLWEAARENERRIQDVRAELADVVARLEQVENQLLAGWHEHDPNDGNKMVIQ